MNNNKLSRHSLQIIVPATFTLILFVLLIFAVVLPYFENSIMERKKEMIQELSNAGWSILNEMNNEYESGSITLEDAQKEAVKIVKNLKYGSRYKDYFWIIDMHPHMIVHPYRPDLDSQDLSEYADAEGIKMFSEFVKIAQSQGEGFVNYRWQHKDDSLRSVPKLSFVKHFEPWNWIIGTGIYVEDVKQEIAEISQRLIIVSLLIFIIVGLAVAYLVKLNFKADLQRIAVSKQLADSHEKYKNLVEASTEGIIIKTDEQYTYCNRFLRNYLGFSEEAFSPEKIEERIIAHKEFADFLKEKTHSGDIPENREIQLRHKNGAVLEALASFSHIDIQGKPAFIITLKDISKHKVTEKKLDESIEKFQAVTDNLDIGIFRTNIDKAPKLLEINKRAREIIGLSKDSDLKGINIFELLSNPEQGKQIKSKLNAGKNIHKKHVKIKRPDGLIISVQLSLVLNNNKEGRAIFCDGIIQDITQQKHIEQEREKMLAELISANAHMNRPVSSLANEIPVCNLETNIYQAAKLMAFYNSDIILVESENRKPLGVITSDNILHRMVAKSLQPDCSVTQVMSAPLVSVPSEALLFEALLLMKEHKIHHICIENHDKSINRCINIKDIALAKFETHLLLAERIKKAETIEELKEVFHAIPQMLKAYIESGSKADIITRLNAGLSDRIHARVAELVQSILAKPPTDFAFVLLGSVGRGEQTLLTDQDNAIIFNDVPDAQYPEVKSYFLKLGKHINDMLHQIGYRYCKGGIMAGNPQNCLSLTEWKNRFRQHVLQSQPKDTMEFSIFFDFRCIAGKSALSGQLQEYLKQLLVNKPLFFYHLAENVLSFNPPISFFGNFVVESNKENKSVFDIKNVIMLITGIARLYSLQHNSEEKNTLQRLRSIHKAGSINEEQYLMLSQNYNYLMLMRFRHQLYAVERQNEANNFIAPKLLSEIERSTLKKIFSQLSAFRSKISTDFKGGQSI